MYRNIPSHVSKEILVLQCGLSYCDSGDINTTINRLKEQKSKVSVISLLGQVFLSESISKASGGILLYWSYLFYCLGNYDVVLNDAHFVRLIMQYVQPPPVLLSDQKSFGYLVQMGFPSVNYNGTEYICLW